MKKTQKPDRNLSRRFFHVLNTVPVADGVAFDVAIGCGYDLFCQRGFN
jgi:hypothetical protein